MYPHTRVRPNFCLPLATKYIKLEKTMDIRKSFTLLFALAVANIASAQKTCAYLFTYFTGNAPEQEQICYTISEDGWNYTPYSPTLSKLISKVLVSLK